MNEMSVIMEVLMGSFQSPGMESWVTFRTFSLVDAVSRSKTSRMTIGDNLETEQTLLPSLFTKTLWKLLAARIDFKYY